MEESKSKNDLIRDRGKHDQDEITPTRDLLI